MWHCWVELYMQDARANEVDSGTELEDEIEEIGAVEEEKGEEEKKEDWEDEETKSPQSYQPTVNVSYSWSKSLNLEIGEQVKL